MNTTTSQPTPASDDPESRLPEPSVSTTQPIGNKSSPRQPNDRDESPDSQASAPRDDMKQAASDVASGQVDTDRHEQPSKNPKNATPATPSPKPSQILPDGTRK